jgi:hypothetical protein
MRSIIAGLAYSAGLCAQPTIGRAEWQHLGFDSNCCVRPFRLLDGIHLVHRGPLVGFLVTPFATKLLLEFTMLTPVAPVNALPLRLTAPVSLLVTAALATAIAVPAITPSI